MPVQLDDLLDEAPPAIALDDLMDDAPAVALDDLVDEQTPVRATPKLDQDLGRGYWRTKMPAMEGEAPAPRTTMLEWLNENLPYPEDAKGFTPEAQSVFRQRQLAMAQAKLEPAINEFTIEAQDATSPEEISIGVDRMRPKGERTGIGQFQPGDVLRALDNRGVVSFYELLDKEPGGLRVIPERDFLDRVLSNSAMQDRARAQYNQQLVLRGLPAKAKPDYQEVSRGLWSNLGAATAQGAMSAMSDMVTGASELSARLNPELAPWYREQQAAAGEFKEAATEVYPLDPNRPVSGAVGQAMGSSLPFLATGVLGAPASAATGAMMGGGTQISEARAAGATPEQQDIALKGGLISGATEAFGIGRGAKGVLKGKFLNRLAKSAPREILEEMGQEGFQTMLNQITAQDIAQYAESNPEANVKELVKNMATAGVVGGMFGGATAIRSEDQPAIIRNADGTPLEVNGFVGERTRPVQVSVPEQYLGGDPTLAADLTTAAQTQPVIEEVVEPPVAAPSAPVAGAEPSAKAATPTTTNAVVDQSITDWDFANRRSRSDEWFEGGNITAANAFSDALAAGADQLQAHGMSKASTLTGGLEALIGMLKNGLDPNRRGGRLDTAQLANKPGEGSVGATASGSAYRDGPFILVQRPGTDGMTGKLENVGAVLVNEAHAHLVPQIREAIHAVRPDITVASFGQAAKVTSELLEGGRMQSLPATPPAPAPTQSAPAAATTAEVPVVESRVESALPEPTEVVEAAQAAVPATAVEQGQAPVVSTAPDTKPVVSSEQARDVSKPEQMTREEYDQYAFERSKALKEEGRYGNRPTAKERAKMAAMTAADYIANLKKIGAEDAGRKEAIELAVRSFRPVFPAAVDTYGIKLPPGYVKRGELYVYETPQEAQSLPGVPQTEGGVQLPAPEAAPVAAPKRIQLKGSPQTYEVVEQLPAQKGDLPGEAYYRVRNEKTGEEQTVESADMKPVSAKTPKPKPVKKAKAEPAKRPDVDALERRLDSILAEHKGEQDPVKQSALWKEAQKVQAAIDTLTGSSGGKLYSDPFLLQAMLDTGRQVYRAGMTFTYWLKRFIAKAGEAGRRFARYVFASLQRLPGKGEGGAIGSAGGSRPKPGQKLKPEEAREINPPLAGAPGEEVRAEGPSQRQEGEYYTRVAERDRGTLSQVAWDTVRNRTTIPDTFKADLEWAQEEMGKFKDIRNALDYGKGIVSRVEAMFGETTQRRRAALVFLISQEAAQQRLKSTNAVQADYWRSIERDAIIEFSDMMQRGGKLLNIAGQLYANIPASPEARVQAADKMLKQLSGGKAAEIEAQTILGELDRQASEAAAGALTNNKLKKLLGAALKDTEQTIAGILRSKSRKQWKQIRTELVKAITDKLPHLTEAQRIEVVDTLIADFEQRMAKAKKAFLDRQKGQKKRASSERLYKLWEAGGLNNDTATQVFQEAAGVVEFTPEFRDHLVKLYEQAEQLPEGMPRNRVLAEISIEIAKANPKGGQFFWDTAMAISYGNILGAFTTLTVNNPLGALTSTQEMLLQLSARDPKAARAALKAYAQSLGDAIAMAKDLWSTGENLQKVNQFDSTLTGNPLELLGRMADDPNFSRGVRSISKAVSQYKWVMRAMMSTDALIRWPAREAIRTFEAARIARERMKPGQTLQDAIDEMNYPGGRAQALKESKEQAAQELSDGIIKTKQDEKLRTLELLQGKLSPEGQEVAAGADEIANYASLLNDQPQDLVGVFANAVMKVAYPGQSATKLEQMIGRGVQPFVRFVKTSANMIRVLADVAVGYGAWRYHLRNLPVLGAEAIGGGVNLIPGRAGDALTQVRLQRFYYMGLPIWAGVLSLLAAIDDDDDPYIDFIGTGPESADERRRLRDSGLKFNSIKVGDKYIPFMVGPLQPLSGILSAAARYRDNKKWPKGESLGKGEREPEKAAVAMAMGVMDSFTNQSFSRGTADFLLALQGNPTSFGESPGEFVAKNASNFLPVVGLRGLHQLDEIVSGRKERADGFFETMLNGIAFYAPNGRAVTLLGDRVGFEEKPVAQRAAEKVLQFTEAADDTALRFVTDNRMSVPDRQRKQSGKRQTYAEYNAMLTKAGQRMRRYLETEGGLQKLQAVKAEGKSEKGNPTYPRRTKLNQKFKEFWQEELLKQP